MMARRKVATELPQSVVDDLKYVAAVNGRGLTETLMEAITLRRFALDAETAGGKLIVETRRGNLQDVVLVRH